MHVYCTYGLIDRFAPLQHDSFDDGTSDESWLNRQNVLNPQTKASVSELLYTASWIQMVDY